MTTDLNKMNRVIRLLRIDETITGPIRLLLDSEFGEWTVEEFSSKSSLDIAEMLALKSEISDPIGVAEALFNALNRLKLMQTPKDAPQEPIQVEVKLPANIATMDLEELLKLLAADKTRFDKVYPYIEQDATFRRAMSKTENLAVVNSEGSLDADRTYQYICQLNRIGGRVREMVGGQPTVTLEKSVGVESRPLAHPFTGEAVSGPDENGYDYGLLSAELHKALIWARTTQHAAWPGSVDIFTHSEEIFAETLNKRWDTVLKSYRRAVENEDPEALSTSRYWTEPVREQAGATRFVIVTPAPQPTDDDYYKRLLLEKSNSDFTYNGGVNGSVPGGIYGSLNVLSGVNTRIDGAVALFGGCILGVNTSGTLYVPRNVGVRMGGVNNSVNIMQCSYEELCRMRRLS